MKIGIQNWSLFGILIILALFPLSEGNYWRASQSILFLVFFFVAARYLPQTISSFYCVLAILSAIGGSLNFYKIYKYYDVIVHVYYGITGSLIATYLTQNIFIRLSSNAKTMLISCIVFTLGVLWEIFEWLSVFYIPEIQITSLNDAMSDVIFDGLGILLYSNLLRNFIGNIERDAG